MFLDYRKPSKELVVDLINRDNPNLPFPINYDNCNIISPTAVNNPSVYGFRNTEVTLVPHDSVNWRGPTRVAYRRLEAKDLFPGGRVLISAYLTPANIAKDTYVGLINDYYGTKIDVSEISTGAISNAVGTGTLMFHPGCLAFVGNIPYSRLQAMIPLDTKVPAVGLDWLPAQPVGGYDYTSVLYGVDFTPFDHLIEGAGNAFQNPASAGPLMSVMSAYAGVGFGPGTPRPLDTSTIRTTIYTGYSDTRPLMNPNYQRVMIITPVNANSWLKGPIYLHFDKDDV